MPKIRRLLLVFVLSLSPLFRRTEADDAAAVDDAYQGAGDDDYYNDDGAAVADSAYYEDDNQGNYDNYYYEEGEDYIQYWTDFAILPKRCVV